MARKMRAGVERLFQSCHSAYTSTWGKNLSLSTAHLLTCAIALLTVAAISGQAAFAQPHIESANYWTSYGSVEVRLDGPVLWTDWDLIRLGAAGQSAAPGSVSYDNDTTFIILEDARRGFDGLPHPRCAAVLAGGVNGTDDATHLGDMRTAISHDDAEPPQAQSAICDAGDNILKAAFNEPISGVDARKIIVRDADDIDMPVDAVLHDLENAAMQVELGASDKTPSMLAVSAGGVADLWGNANPVDLYAASASPMNGATTAPPVNGTQPPANHTAPPVNGTQPPANHTAPPVNGTQPPANHTAPPVNGTAPPVNGTAPPVNGTAPPVNGTAPPVNGTAPPVNGTAPPVNGTAPPVNGTAPPVNGTAPPVNGTQPPANHTAPPPANGTTAIQFSGVTYNTATGELRFDTDYNGILFAPAGGQNVTLTAGIYSVTVPAANPDCPDPLGSCTGNGAVATINEREWFADSPTIYVNAPPGLLAAGVPGNITGMTVALNHSNVTVPNPIFKDAAYHTGNGTISVQFDKDIGSVNGSKMGIAAGGNAEYLAGDSTISGSTVRLALSDTDMSQLAGVASLTMHMGKGAVTSTGGYPNAAIGVKNVTIFDGIKPAFENATYYTGNGTISIQFSEIVGMANGSKLILAAGANTVPLSTNAVISHHVVTGIFNQTGRDLFAHAGVMSLAVRQGAVADTAGNYIDASANNTVSVRDTTKPTVLRAVYYAGNGTVLVQFSEAITAAHGITLRITYGNDTLPLQGAASNDTMTATLEFEDRTKIFGAMSLNLTIPAGTVQDLHGNRMDAVLDMPMDIVPDNAELGVAAGTSANAASFGADDFVTTWETKNANERVTINVGGHTGTYTVNWGDGTTTTQSGNVGHAYTTAGSYNVSISGDFQRIKMGDSTNAKKLVALVQWGNASWSSMADSFRDAQNMVYKATDRPDLSRVTDMSGMFWYAYAFNGDISTWEVSSVTDMSYMFHYARDFNGSLSSWDVSSVTNMISMFDNAPSFNGDISTWNVSAVTDMRSMFVYARDFNGSLSSWDVSSVTDMRSMFFFATAFNGDISTWDVSSVTNMARMFDYAQAFNGDISSWDVSSVTDMSLMFYGASAFNQNLGPWYAVLDNNALNINGTTVGNIAAQNSVLRGHGPTYSLASGAGDTDNSLFEISGNTLSIKQAPSKSSYSVRIGVGGSGLFGQNNAIVQQIVADIVRPTLLSASYHPGTGVLAVSFSESLDASKHAAPKFHIRESGQNTGGITLSNGMITANGSDSITFDLNATNAAAVNALTAPQIDVDAGAVRDTSGNTIAATYGQPIAVIDVVKPGFASATYKTGTGVMIVTFNETLDSSKHVASKFHIRNAGSGSGGVTLSNGTITANGTNSLTFTLGGTDKNSVNAMAVPQLDIDAGAVSDSAGNAVDADPDNSITLDDVSKPIFTSATYKTGGGILAVTFNETLDSSKHVASKFHIRNAGSGSGGVTLSNGTITANGTDFITFTLGGTDKNSVNAMAVPQLDIDAGAVSDSAGNAIASVANQTITVRDTIKPTFASAAYKTGSGVLNVTFSEPLDSSKHVASKFHIRNAGSGSGGVTLSNGTITANGTDFITFTLGGTDKNSVNAMAVPQLDIDAGAVSDSAGNAIASVANQTITVRDTIKPTFASAAYRTATGVLNVTFSEPLDSSKHVASKFHIRNAGSGSGVVTLSNVAITANGTDFITFTLGAANKTAVNSMSEPRLGIGAGAVRDAAGNVIAAASDLPMSVIRPPPPPAPASSPPAFGGFGALPVPEAPLISMTHDKAPEPLEASYDSATYGVSVTFDEPVSVLDPDGFTLALAGDSLKLQNFSNGMSRTLNASAPGNATASHNATLIIRADAVADGSGAGNLAHNVTASVYDSAAPRMQSAVYNEPLGVLTVSFDQPVNNTNPALFRLGNSSLGNMSRTVASSDASVYLTLNASGQDAITEYPYLSLAEGAATGPNGKASAPVSNAAVHLRYPLDNGSVRSAVYDTVSGTLWLDISGESITLNASAVTLGGTSLSDIRVRLNGELVSDGNGTVSPTDNMSLDIPHGAVADPYSTLPHIPSYPVYVFDGVTDAIVSEAPGNATATRAVRHAGAVYAASVVPGGIYVWDAFHPNGTGRHVAVGGTILDLEPVEISGSTYVAVLTNTTLSLLDVAAPAEPLGAVRHDSAIPYGTVSQVTLEGIEHLALITPDGIRLVLVHEPASPRLVSAAALRDTPGAGLDSVSAGSGHIITTLGPDRLCLLDVNDVSKFAADCREHSGDPGTMSHGIIQGVPRVAVAGTGMSVYNASLGLLMSVETGSPITDVSLITVYGAPYVAVIDSGAMRIYDVSGDDPALAAKIEGSFVSLDAVEFEDSAYVLLTGSDGSVYLVDLTHGVSRGGLR